MGEEESGGRGGCDSFRWRNDKAFSPLLQKLKGIAGSAVFFLLNACREKTNNIETAAKKRMTLSINIYKNLDTSIQKEPVIN